MWSKSKKVFAVFALAFTMAFSLLGIAVIPVSAGGGSTPPSGFCNHSYGNNSPFFVSAGTPKMSNPCAGHVGSFIMDLHGKQYGHKSYMSWKKLEAKRTRNGVLRAATYWFDELQSKPSNFCTAYRPNNPGWHLPTGIYPSAPCKAYSGKYALTIRGHVYRGSWKHIMYIRRCNFHGYEATVYFERSKSNPCGC